jgi:hypothetical protein
MTIRLVGYYEHNGGYISNAPTSRTYQRPPISCGAFDQNGNCIQPIDTGLPNAPITVTNQPTPNRTSIQTIPSVAVLP